MAKTHKPTKKTDAFIGIISDTHGHLSASTIQSLKGVDRIIHAGDIGKPEILDTLGRIAPVDAVRGNMDGGKWAQRLPDMGIQGEGEIVFPVLLDHLASHKDITHLPGLFLPGKGLQEKRSFVKNLDKLPFPAVDLFQIKSAPDSDFLLPFQTRRGCPLNCSYCSTATIEGRRLRYRSIDRVVRELGLWRGAGFTRFFFVDNTFNLPRSYAKALCKALAQASLDISWRCILYPGKVSENLIREMAGAGCREVSLGFESGCQKILDGFNKHFRTSDIERTSRMLSDYGIRQTGFLLLGGPGETKQTVEESLRFVQSLPLDLLKITMGIRIYPGTKLSELSISENRINSETDLLSPTFYICDDLSDWLRQTLLKWQGTAKFMVMMEV